MSNVSDNTINDDCACIYGTREDGLACFKREFCNFLKQRNINALESDFIKYRSYEDVAQHRILAEMSITQKLAEIKIVEAFLARYRKRHPTLGNELRELSMTTNSDYFKLL